MLMKKQSAVKESFILDHFAVLAHWLSEGRLLVERDGAGQCSCALEFPFVLVESDAFAVDCNWDVRIGEPLCGCQTGLRKSKRNSDWEETSCQSA